MTYQEKIKAIIAKLEQCNAQATELLHEKKEFTSKIFKTKGAIFDAIEQLEKIENVI